MIVWVTRDEPEDGPLSTALRAAGLEVVLTPVLERRVVSDASDEIAQLGSDDWLVLTSAFAAESVAREPALIPRVAVVGNPSKLAAEKRGIRVQLVSPTGTAAGLFDALRATVSGGKVCYPRSSLVSPPEPWLGVSILSPILYETTARPYDPAILARVDVVSVASPSAVRAVGRVDLPFASIGPTTSAALRELDITPWVEGQEKTFDSLAKTLANQRSPSR